MGDGRTALLAGGKEGDQGSGGGGGGATSGSFTFAAQEDAVVGGWSLVRMLRTWDAILTLFFFVRFALWMGLVAVYVELLG